MVAISKKNQSQNQNQRIRIRLKSFDYLLIDEAARQIYDTAKRTGAIIHGPIPLPTKKERHALTISPNADKDAQQHFQLHIYKRLLDIVRLTDKTVDELIKLNLRAGVEVQISVD